MLITTGILFVLSLHSFVTFISSFLYLKACQILSVKYFYQQVQWNPTWCMFVLWSFWLLCLVDLHLLFRPCEQQNLIVPLHVCLLLLVLLRVCIIFLSVVSPHACIVSSVCNWLLSHVSVSILCLLLLDILILWGLQSLYCL